MVRANAKSKPKLKAKGGECRYLILFAVELSATLTHISHHWQTVHELFCLMHSLQKEVSTDVYNAPKAQELCRRFCILYEILGGEAWASAKYVLWQMKPKCHLLQEVIEFQALDQGSPRFFWTYRDESWCGWWAKASRRRGGAATAANLATRLLTRFRAFCS